MAEKSTVKATPEGLILAKNALRRLFLGKISNLADQLGTEVGRSSVYKFFNQKPITVENFQAICNKLTLGFLWQEIAGLINLHKSEKEGKNHRPEKEEGDISLLNPPDLRPQSDQGEETGSKGSDFSPETSSTRDTHFFQYTIALYVKNPDEITRENLLEKTRVIPKKPGSMNLFDLVDTPLGRNKNWYLKNLVNHLQQGINSRWLEELVDYFYLTTQGILNNCGSQSQEVQSMFRTSKGKLYRSMFHKIETLGDGSGKVIKLIIIFDEEFSWGYMKNPPSLSYSTLLTALNLGSRLQHEVCEKYLPLLILWQKEGLGKIDILLLEISNTFGNIDKEAELRREGEANYTTNEDRLINCFESEDEKDTIKNNMLRQEEYKQILRNANNMQDNVNLVIDALTNLISLNSIVLDMVGKQFSQMLTQICNKNSP